MNDQARRIPDEALEQLQTKIAYLEQANAELGDLVFRQHLELKALGKRIDALAERLSAALAEERRAGSDEERPPHY